MTAKRKKEPLSDADSGTDKGADGGDAADIPFGPVATSRIKDPADGPNSWHICRDFIDPLAAELEEWLRNPESTPDDLKWFDVGLKRLGPTPTSTHRDCARTFLMGATS